ncbi:MAG TPA: proline-rich domain-containing protein, partial [Acidimicrobiales bacterium]|nr:proline-rich domain-containing protein [Acidimicrobiales bacterium]
MWQQRQAVALRPLGAGERIDAAIKIVRRNFLTFAKASLVVAVPAAVVISLILVSVISSLQSAFKTNSQGELAGFTSGSALTVFGGFALLYLFSLLVLTLITAISFRIVGNFYLGQPTGWRDAVVFGLKRFHSVLWIEFLLVVILYAFEIAISLIDLVLGLAHAGGAAVAVAAVLGIGEFVFVIWFWVATSMAVPVMMIENIRGSKAIRRSVSLSRHHWWTTFGTLLLAGLLAGVGFLLLALLTAFVSGIAGGGAVVRVIEFGVDFLLGYLLFASFIAAVEVVITIDLRVRKEGFDIQLLASQMGVTPTGSALSFMPTGPGRPGYGGYPGPGWQGGYGYPPPGGAYPPPGGPPGPGWQPPPPQGWAQQPPPPQGWAQPPPPPQGWAQQPPPPQGWA